MANEVKKTYATAARRWEGVGPYYAMFPTHFADAVISEYSSRGDTILDPFAGRGTAIFSSAICERFGVGVEINPVGWVYTKAKINPAPFDSVLARLLEIGWLADEYVAEANALPKFFQRCYSHLVCCFLLAARANLDWRRNKCDRTLMALLLVYLHGKKGQALSNQMRQTKSMSPTYALKWWEERGMEPPALNPIDFIEQRLHWRYAKGTICQNKSQVFLGDTIAHLPMLNNWLAKQQLPKPSLLLTSPPYCGVTNYHYDQWLRLWLLGFPADAYMNLGPYQGRFKNQHAYQKLLNKVFLRAASIVKDDAVIYVRTSNSTFTKEATLNALRQAFPCKKLDCQIKPFTKPTQTHLFGDKTKKDGEVDLILS